VRYYENLFIVNPNYEHDKLSQIVEAVNAEITRLNGIVLYLEDWGKRRLAYPIEKHRYGNYILVQYETENSKLNNEIEAWMGLTAGILSCITVQLEEKPAPKPESEIALKPAEEII